MKAVLGAARLMAMLAFASIAAFFAWWSLIVLRNMFDASADNSRSAYFLVGAPLAALAVLCLALAWTVAQGDRVRFTRIAAVTLGLVFLLLIAWRLFG